MMIKLARLLVAGLAAIAVGLIICLVSALLNSFGLLLAGTAILTVGAITTALTLLKGEELGQS